MAQVNRSGVLAMHAFTKNDISCNLILSDGYITGSRKTTGTHFHAFYEVHYIISGTVSVILDEKEIILDEGTICIIPPQVIHRLIERNGSNRVGFRFSFTRRKCDQPKGYYDRFSAAFGGLKKAHMMTDTTMFKHCFHASRAAMAENAPDYTVDELLFLAIDHLSYVLSQAPQVLTLTGGSHSDSLLSEYIEDYLNTNYRGSPKIGVLADSMDVSIRQAQRIINRLFGKSFSELLTIKRLTVAKHMLRNTTISIEEVAQATGFCDKQYLCRKFSAKFGISPAKYRLSKQSAAASVPLLPANRKEED